MIILTHFQMVGSISRRFTSWVESMTANNFVLFPDGFDGLWYVDTNYFDYYKRALSIPCYSYFNEDTFSMPFVTNYPYDIKGSSLDFYSTSINPIVRKSEPHLLNSFSDLQMSSFDVLGILYPNYSFYVDTSFNIINQNTKETVLSIKCNDYKDYVSRSDIEDPFSYLSFNIPLSVLPSFELLENTQYNFQVSYSIGSATIYDNNYVLVAVPLNHIQSSGTGGEGEGGGSTSTPEDDRNQQLQNSIFEGTDKIVESNKETQEKLEEQTNAIKEGNETNKNIFQKIGDIFDLLNPFSENFFGRKLVELLVDGLKSLFVPSNDFMVEFFGGLSDWFEARLGFLWTPFDIVSDFLEKLYDSDFGEPVIHIPNIQEPFTNVTLISASDINLNDIKNNKVFSNIYDIYLVLVDFAIYIGLIALSYNTLVGVFRGSPDSITLNKSNKKGD